MNDSAIDFFRLLGVVALVLANGFFVAAEFSLVSVRRTRIAELVAQGSSAAKWVEKALENPDRVIAATQLGITLSSLGLGWIGEPAVTHLIEPLVALFPSASQAGVSYSISAALAFVLITFMHVVVGELAPKSIALQNPEKTSLTVAQPTLWTEIIFKPAIWALNGAGNALLRLIGIKPVSGHELLHSIEELKMLVSASAEGGVVEEHQSEMLAAIFDLSDQVVRQMMVPRTEIQAVQADTSLAELLQLVTEFTYTKYPVYEESLDQIIGILHVKDLLRIMYGPDKANCTARTLMREAMFVPEALPVDSLLLQFRNNRQHIAIVLDEFGGTAGLVTLEDVLEEIVGEVSDPFDQVTPDIQTMANGLVLIDGMTLIEDVNEQLGLDLHDSDYDTIAGFMLGRLGRIARVGDTVETDNFRLRVEVMDNLRIAQISLMRLSPDENTMSPSA
jgi:CBS domain containing-hemolysin-like protein